MASRYNDLKTRLLKEQSRLLDAASQATKDSAFLYDTLYCAVCKVRESYRHIANKDLVVELCLLHMKQPKRHAKHGFSSAEECIERALSSTAPGKKTILSVAALILVAAILLPVLFFEEATVIDPRGFVMEGTEALGNLIDGEDIIIQNYHEISKLGAIDPYELAGTEASGSRHDNGYVTYNSITSPNGVTYLVQSYVSVEDNKAEFIAYEAKTDGWHLIGRDSIKYVVQTAFVEEGGERFWRTTFSVKPAQLLCDAEGNLYILTLFNEGIQIHRYGTDGRFACIGKIELAKHEQITIMENYYYSTASFDLSALYNTTNNQIDIIFRSTELTGDKNYPTEYKTYLLHFDLKDYSFTEPIVMNDALRSVPGIRNFTTDENGNYYFTGNINRATELFPDEEGIGEFLFCVDETGALTQAINYATFYASPTAKSIYPYHLQYEDGKLHLVYKDGVINYYAVYENGVQISKTKISTLTTDHFYFMGFTLYNGALYYGLTVNFQYILIGKADENGCQRVAEFKMPVLATPIAYNMLHLYSRFTPHDGVINFVVSAIDPTDSEFNTLASYFLQIVLE